MEVQVKKTNNDGIKVKGMFRVRIVNPDGTFAGDSGWNENLVTNDGFDKYLVKALGSIAGSLYISHIGLGTGSAPGAAHTDLDGEVGTRQAVTVATSATSKTLRCTATFAAGWHSSGVAHAISNIGLFNSVSAGTLFAGTTYASSSCASNQAVNTTYDITFA
jgi:hypothetical protein